MHPFDLLAAIGRDCVGALQFHPVGEELTPLSAAKGRSIGPKKIAQILQSLRLQPLGLQDQSDFRVSLAGAQDKTALLKKDGKWMIPEGTTATTHILKPPIGLLPEGPDLALSVENEWLCLKLSESMGLKTAQADIERFDKIKVLSVQRFDRSWSGDHLYRLPQEDLCQAVGVGPDKKYESDGGPGVLEIMSLLNESDDPAADRHTFMKAQIFFWLIAAIDGHAKNFSIFLRPTGFVLTPLYDILSAEPHLNPKPLSKRKIKLAMAVGDSRHWKVQEILPPHWIQTAKKARFAGIAKFMDAVIHRAPQCIEDVQKALPRDFPVAVSEPIFEGMLRRLEILKRG